MFQRLADEEGGCDPEIAGPLPKEVTSDLSPER